MRKWLWIILVFVPTMARAQSEFVPYAWVEGDFALQVPADWQTASHTQDTQVTLTIAQAFANDDTNRPLAIPFIKVSVVSALDLTNFDLQATLANNLQDFGIADQTVTPTKLLDQAGFALSGTNNDGTLFGLNRGAVLPDGTLLIIGGRTLATQEPAFTTLFNAVADSLVVGAGSNPVSPQYGVLWSTLTAAGQGSNVFGDVRGLTFAQNRLLLVDGQLGIVEFSPQTGDVLAVTPFDEPADPTGIALATNGAIDISDPTCRCIRTWFENGWTKSTVPFAENAPQYITVGQNDTLYATDLFAVDADNSVAFVQVLTPAGASQLSFEDALARQPLLTVDLSGKLLAIAPDDYTVYRADENGFSTVMTLTIPPLAINAVAIDTSNNMVVTTEEGGVLLFNGDGTQIGTLGSHVEGLPQAGEFVHPQGVAVGSDGTVYVADSGFQFGRLTAMSLNVEAGRIGANALVNGVAVEGALDNNTPQQSWTISAQKGDVVTLTAISSDPNGFVDVALRLLDTDNTELAYNDFKETGGLPNPTDAQIEAFKIPKTGVYSVVVERVGGQGRYSLGFSQAQVITLSDDMTILTGTLSDVVASQAWIFEGTYNTTFTMTLVSDDGVLDPLLRLLDASGKVIAENDDAIDASLGRNAQLVGITLPNSGTYTLVAVRAGGIGQFTLTVQKG